MDHRVRIRPLPGQEDLIYGSSITGGLRNTQTTWVPNDENPSPPINSTTSFTPSVMAPLRSTNGMIFPYTPNIRWGNDNDYQSLGLVHTNSDYSYFIRQQQLTINISGEFTAQNVREARYLLACIHFLSSNSKMRFGASDNNRGLPPPILLLSGYGKFIFPDLPVLIKSWNVDYTNTVDTVEVRDAGGNPYAYVPSKTTITVDLLVQKRPIDYLREFNLDKFRSGQLFMENKGFR